MSILRRFRSADTKLTLAGESASIFREIEHEIYLEVGREFGEIFKRLVYPSTMDNPEKFPQISPNFVVEEISHITQVGIFESGVKYRIRKIIDAENQAYYQECVKISKNGTRLETECDVTNDNQFLESAFLLLFNSADQYQVKTRLSIGKFKNNPKIKVDIDVPLLEGSCPYSKPKWGKFIKVDIEHDGTLKMEDALRMIDIPYLRIVTDKEELSTLNKTIFSRSNIASVKYVGDMVLSF